jgi:hypothetical protein
MAHSLWNLTDDQLGLTSHDPRKELDRFLASMPRSALQHTLSALGQGLFVRHSYQKPGGKGCLLYHLVGVKSKSQLFDYDFGSREMLITARRIVRWFDYGTLTDVMIADALAKHIAAREGAAARERDQVEPEPCCVE